jgi:IS5 family transposase
VAPKLAHQVHPAKPLSGQDLAGAFEGEFGGGVSPAGRPRLPVRLMVSLLYLKHSFNLSDEEVVQRWAENVQWQFFSGMDYYEPRLPCDATQIGRFRRLLDEDGLEQLLKATIDCAVDIQAIKPAELERVIVDSTVQSKAIAHPVDSRLLEIARHKVASSAKRAGIALKQTFAKEGKTLRRQAGGYGHARQFKRLRRVVKRQRTILGVVMREVQRKCEAPQFTTDNPQALAQLKMWLERAERIRTQQRNSKDKLYALHAPEVECISKGKARNPYEFGVKVSLVVTHQHERRLLKRRQAIEPLIGHTKADHRMDRCWLQGALGDALHALSCAAGYNICWLLRAITRLGLRGLFDALSILIAFVAKCAWAVSARTSRSALPATTTADVSPTFMSLSLAGG